METARHKIRICHAVPISLGQELRTLFPLTAFKNTPNPKFVQNLSQRLFFVWDKWIMPRCDAIPQRYLDDPQRWALSSIDDARAPLEIPPLGRVRWEHLLLDREPRKCAKNLSKICKFVRTLSFFQFFDKFLTDLTPDWNPEKRSSGQILDKFGARGIFESCKGKKGLSDPTERLPLSRDRCSNTPVALCFL